MPERAGRPLRQQLVAVCVLVLHGAVVTLQLQLQPRLRGPAEEDIASVWLVINPPLPPAEPAPQEPAPDEEASIRTRTPRAAPASTAITVPLERNVAPAPAPPINWDRARENLARGHAEKLQAARPRDFGRVEPSRPFKVCKRPKNSWEWKSEPGKVGMAGGILPYARLGRRCVIGLGFFGCSLDEPPPANGKLLDSMADPDKPTSSVPSEADCLPDEIQPAP